MVINIHGDKLDITNSIKEYVGKKIGRLDKYFEKPDDIKANVLVRVRGKEEIVEVTIPIKKMILRAEVTSKDLYNAIDTVSDKLERQIRKNKTRMKKKNSKDPIIDFNLDFESDIDIEKNIVKRKTLEMKPMSEEEAILQMELIDHDFFVFKNAETNDMMILYKRKDGDYGIIETK